MIDFTFGLNSILTNLITGDYRIFAYLVVFIILFLETGVVVTPLIPGDSLLFLAGTLLSSKTGFFEVLLVFLFLATAAILGDSLNYIIGKSIGNQLIKRKLVDKKNLQKTENFYKKYGGKTVFLARFFPIIRTIAPFVAGVGNMNYPKFLFYNISGGLSWVALFLFTGYFFGSIPIVKNNLSLVIILIILISFIPAVYTFLKRKTK